MRLLSRSKILLAATLLLSSCTLLNKNTPSKLILGKNLALQTLVLETPEYDGSYGKTKISIYSVPDNKKTKDFVLEGIWHCLGYITSRKSFFLVGEFQEGACLPLTKIKYLSEDNYEVTDSKYRYNAIKGDNDPLSWNALTAVPSEDLKYIAFVGDLGKANTRLIVLNTDKDLMTVLGDPPAPPPISDPYWQKEALRQSPDNWVWDFPCVDGYVEMDNGIIRFNKDTLSVSYGNDTVIKRSGKRKTKTWKLKI